MSDNIFKSKLTRFKSRRERLNKSEMHRCQRKSIILKMIIGINSPRKTQSLRRSKPKKGRFKKSRKFKEIHETSLTRIINFQKSKRSMKTSSWSLSRIPSLFLDNNRQFQMNLLNWKINLLSHSNSKVYLEKNSIMRRKLQLKINQS